MQLGQEAVVKVASMPDREFRGRVTFVYPTVDEKTRTAKVRLEFENPGYFLKPGMFVSAQIQAELDDSAVLVPEEAVLRSGAKNTVFVALAGGKFEARDVTLGVEAENDLIQVISGLNAGERVVTSGQFLLDSESQLREAIEKMRGPTPAAKLGQWPSAIPRTKSPPPRQPRLNRKRRFMSARCRSTFRLFMITRAIVRFAAWRWCRSRRRRLKKIQPGGKVLYYTCPMPEHASVHEDKPGKCPLCAMTLIPVMAQPATPTNATAKQVYYCPMHPEVISDEPGKCPKCGMDLVLKPDATK